ncbi:MULTISPECIES: TetR/AcrR family transcriptional regulator [Bacillus]|uniref:TetR/AcrR family transcriptional regulator n=1 Tax=Bacillus TaxID=1386 RepID=UPI000477825E|nr:MULTISPECIES: TetR/AcrR family transcriptional regulator [Bacillus]
MKEKEKIIIEAAIKLFAGKGFSSTSINEIVTESGISKGAFYLYFKSKDALLYSIFDYYSEQLRTKIFSYENEKIAPREKFSLQLLTMLETLMEHKEFLIMQSREQAIPLNESIKKQIFQMHVTMHNFLQNGLLQIYGEKIRPFIWDLSFILEGMVQSYTKIVMYEKEPLQLRKIIDFLLRRMDHIIEGIVEEEPVLTSDRMKELLDRSQNCCHSDFNQLLANMKEIINTLDGKEDLEVSLEVLAAEIQSVKPRIPVIQGMLSNFREIPELQAYYNKIAEFYHIK